MSQSALTVGLLGVAFILYLAAKGRLPAYTAVLWGDTSAVNASANPESSSSSGPTLFGISLSTLVKVGEAALSPAAG
jgi:hypothetical protein